MHAGPQLTVSRNDLVQSYINTEPDLASWTYHDTFCECPKRLMMPWLHRFRCMLVVHHKSQVSWAVLNQAIAEWKCLIPGSFPRRVETFLNIVLILTVASGCCSAPPSAVVLIDCSSESPADTVCVSLTLRPAPQHISPPPGTTEGFVLVPPRHEGNIQGCQSEQKETLLFSSFTELHWSHWSVVRTPNWLKKMNECSVFHSVLWLHTNDFLDLLLLSYFFCNGCR